MAALMIRTCLKRSFTKNLSCKSFNHDGYVKFNISLFNLTCLQCNSYHNTFVLFKKRKTAEVRKQLQQLKELEMLNPKTKKESEIIEVWRNMTVKELAAVSRRSIDDILDALFFIDQSTIHDSNSIFEDPSILYETVKKLGLKLKVISNPKELNTHVTKNKRDVVKRPPPDPLKLVKRKPVITIMGHVDHGKTTLLDALRDSAIVDSEFGGITQHIGAFNVTLSTGEKMTFLDTPGHAAFSAMRARGANTTDIVILVVAADDGVMEQTVQSIEMAKNANVPIIVAVNKIDKPGVIIDRTHHMLAENGIVVEALGGDVQSINISALKKTNLDLLMEAVATQAEIMNLKGDPTGMVEGVVIEATNDVHRGKLATALIQRGTLRKGDVLVSGLAWAKVRAMFDENGLIVSEANLSDAVQIIGWRELPEAGEEILEVESEKQAHMVVRYRNEKLGQVKSIEQKIVADQKHQEHLIEYRKIVQKKRLLGKRRLKPEGPKQKEIQVDDFPKVNVIIKGDVVGSVEAILDVLDTYSDEKKCRLSIVHYGVGAVTETDIELANVFGAIIYCFNTTTPRTLTQEITKLNIPVRHHNVIYRMIDDLKIEINKQLPMVSVEEVIGEASVLKEFDINIKRKKVKVAGCRCVKGSIKKSGLFKVIRNGEEIYRGKANEIRHLKDEVETIKTNQECGIMFDAAQIEFEQGDQVICYRLVDKMQETDWNPF
ncbi:translation initiation factor IF-2, mitochondrial [Phymastichus coffea]|uniref:translation initiation factor IF-2, mitochondrial n=1 Tax=Phymastichus coffea TaxID=108790 RepID=UPI00273CCDB5|nr:translation initiation factor IF-2, mitochondrial [Phymastichus coffea]